LFDLWFGLWFGLVWELWFDYNSGKGAENTWQSIAIY
jgi:hypothetical protein